VVEAEVGELEVLNTVQLRTRGKVLGVVPVGDKRKVMWRLGLRAARGAVQQAAAAATVAVTEAHALAAGATATAAEAAAELRKQGASVSERECVRKLALSDGWQTTPAAVARRVVEDERRRQEDAVEVEDEGVAGASQ
jgi:hypothetical protein